MVKKSLRLGTLSLALIGLGGWLVKQHVYAQQHGAVSASASVGPKANTSASANVYSSRVATGSSTWASYPASSAVTLMITDVNGDGVQDIKVLLTTPPLPAANNFPSASGGIRARHGVFVMDGASGLTWINTVVTTPGPPGP